MDSEFSRLTEIGKVFGVSSRVCGRWVADLGLRVVGGDPTPRAYELGLVKSAPIACGAGDAPFLFGTRNASCNCWKKRATARCSRSISLQRPVSACWSGLFHTVRAGATGKCSTATGGCSLGLSVEGPCPGASFSF